MGRTLSWGFAVLVIAALVVRGFRNDIALVRYEQRARAAEETARQQQAVVRAYAERVAVLEQSASRRDTVIVRQRERVVAIDATNPPPDSCAPNLAARDDLIATQAEQIATKDSIAILRGRALAALQLSHDTLLTVLADRPKPSKWHGPSVGVGVFGGYCVGGPCVGVGVTVNLVGRKL